MPKEKLVRDRIPEIIFQRTGLPTKGLRTADNDKEYWDFLCKKLMEEAAEHAADGSPEELADVLEVVHAMLRTQGLDMSDIEKVRKKKALERGAFDARFIMTIEED